MVDPGGGRPPAGVCAFMRRKAAVAPAARAGPLE